MTDSNAEPASADEESLDARLVRELAKVLNETGLTEIEVERGSLKIRVAKSAPAAVPTYTAAPLPVPVTAPTPTASPAPKPAGHTVKSPMVGTVYLQSQPGAAPFVSPGDRVSQGQTLLLVEAMKTMNPIVAPIAGVVLELLVADGQPVEYGEALTVIGPAGA
jgi:acetyl-CoA carboxylase biotin carboxyl carrier protein